MFSVNGRCGGLHKSKRSTQYACIQDPPRPHYREYWRAVDKRRCKSGRRDMLGHKCDDGSGVEVGDKKEVYTINSIEIHNVFYKRAVLTGEPSTPPTLTTFKAAQLNNVVI
jgi:hypothetical protein